jgi:hypothetical protein
MKPGGAVGGERGGIECARVDLSEPGVDQLNYRGDIEAFVDGGKFREIGAGELEERRGGCGPALLQMDECAGKLDEALIKCGGRVAAVGQPEFLEDFVGFVEQLVVEALEEGKVMGIEIPPAAVLDEGRDFGGFIGHRGKDSAIDGLCQRITWRCRH